MARRRDWGAEYQRRQARARAAGYRNYYDYRLHLYGRRPPEEEVPRGERMRRAGKRGPASLRAALRHPERIALIIEVPTQSEATGQWTRMTYVTTFTDGRIEEYGIDIDEPDDLDYWRDEIDDAEIEFMPYAGKAAAQAA